MKQDRREVGYGPSRSGEHCGRLSGDDTGFCKWFTPHRDDLPTMPGMCRQVSGPINRTFWCKQFKAAYPSPVNAPRRIRT